MILVFAELMASVSPPASEICIPLMIIIVTAMIPTSPAAHL